MSRRMDYVIDLDKPAEALYESFTSRQYWDDLITIHEANALTEIVGFSRDESGTDIEFTHTLSRHNLPPIASAVVPIKIVVTRKQHFDAFNPESRTAKGHYCALVPAAPLDFTGHYVLGQTPTGSELRLNSLCTVNVPLLGGKIEQLILNGLRHLFDAERDFTRDWIASHY
jgi:hypothetical protein